MTFKTLTKAALAGMLFIGVTGVASAGDTQSMAKWKEKASRIVSFNMEYPRISPRRQMQNAHNIVDLRIDHEGRVLDSSFVKSSGSPLFDMASERFADRIDKLPALPKADYANGAYVRVHLLYAESASDIPNMLRTVTQTEQIAEDQSGDGTITMAGVPRIELFMR